MMPTLALTKPIFVNANARTKLDTAASIVNGVATLIVVVPLAVLRMLVAILCDRFNFVLLL